MSGTIDQNFQKKILVCIPAYNEQETISEIVHSARFYAQEVVVYDDGSKDNTAGEAKAAGALVIRSNLNRGYGVAIRSLLEIAKQKEADIMVTLDSDGQHDPAQIPKVIESIQNGEADIVIGSRFLRNDDSVKVPRYRSIGIKTITRLTQVASYGNLTDAQSGFRAYGKTALSQINLFEGGMSVSTEILVRAKEKGLAVREVPVTVRYDVKKSSTHNPISHGLSVSYSIMQFISLKHPLVFYGLPGIALLILSIVYASFAMELYSSTKYISTNMIIVSVGSAVVGVVLLATGVILFTLTALLKGRIKEI